MRGDDPLASVNLLELRPVRAAAWEEADGRVVVERPRPRARGLKAPVEWLSYLMSVRRIRLDPVCSHAWRQLDGSRTVEEVAARLRQEFGDAVEPAEERLGHLVRMMRDDGLLAYPGWDEAAAGAS